MKTVRPTDVVTLRESDRRDWQRHPVDVARLVTRVVLLALVLLAVALWPSALTNVSDDLVNAATRLPQPMRYALVGVAQLTVMSIPVIVVGWLLTRRRSVALMVVGSGFLAAIVMWMATGWLQRAAPSTGIDELVSASFLPTEFPSVSFLAALSAGATTASPMMTAFWRRVAWAAVVIAATVRLLSATQPPVSVAVTIVLGGAVGSAVLVAFGSPRRRPGAATLRDSLDAAGFAVDDLGDEASHRGLRTYRGMSDDGPVDVVYIDRDDRDVELLARIVRSIRVRDVDDQSISTRPRFRVTQLAAVTSMAQRSGATVPSVLAIAPSANDSAIVASSRPAGDPLDQLGGDEVSDAALDELWRQVGLLHHDRIAHRSLVAGALYVDGDEVTIGGLDDAVIASSAESRAVDRAQLLVTTAIVVGADRALDAAVRTVDPDDLVAALPFVQSPALPTRTQRIARKHKGLVAELRTGLQERLDVESVELAELKRVSFGQIVSWVGFAVLAFFVLTLVSSWSEIREAMSGIDWIWVVPLLIATVTGTIGGAMSLSGSVVRPIALGEATIIMFGQSFLNRFTPMNAGGMAMRIRYLQKGGTDATVATAAIGLTSAASGVVQVVFIAFFFLWSSSDPTSGLTDGSGGGGGPDFTIIIVFALAVIVAGIAVAATPKLRRWVVEFVRSTVAKIKNDFGELLHRPTKLALLFGGSAIGKLSTIVAFTMACRAFDINLPFAELGALYLAATTVASAVPTPGGVGAVEAALVFVLTNAGVDDATAWAAVLLFRLVNFWLPTVPGYIALRYSERRGLV